MSPLTGPDGNFRLDNVPSVPRQLTATFWRDATAQAIETTNATTIDAEPGQADSEIVLDPNTKPHIP